MAADLHIHIKTPEVTEEVLATFFATSLGSKYFNWDTARDSVEWDTAYDIIANTPAVWVGEVSWLKAALFDDEGTYIPDVVGMISDIIGEEFPIIDDDLIAKIANAFSMENKTSYQISKRKSIIDFLTRYKGERVFTVSW